MKLTVLIVSCLLFAAVHSAAVVPVDPDSAYPTHAKRSTGMEVSIRVPGNGDKHVPTKQEMKAMIQEADTMLQIAADNIEESGTVVTSPEKDEKRDGSSAEKDDIVLTIA